MKHSLTRRRSALLGVCTWGLLLPTACSHGLTHDEASQVIRQNALIRPADQVSVEAISTTSDSESVVKATIAGQAVNLKLRRYDKGWAWEFAETKAGGWIAPDVAIAEIRETHRAEAAKAWADTQRDAYRTTAIDMNVMMIYAPGPPVRSPLTEAAWLAEKHKFLTIFQNDTRPEIQQRLKVLRDDHAADAWGSEFVMAFNSSKNLVLLSSLGPDKKLSTDDDIISIAEWRQTLEDGELRWMHTKSWRVPEGLGSTVEEFTDKPYGSIEYAKVTPP
jgi:hypothetical protein